jgi:hypothetical protein
MRMNRLIVAAAIAAAVSGGVSVPSQAADFGPVYRSDFGPGYKSRYARTMWRFSHWRDRCAYAGYYCLYAWDGYVYHYPFDDRPSAYGHYRRYRHRG